MVLTNILIGKPNLFIQESSYGFEPDRKVSPKHQGKFEQMMAEEAMELEVFAFLFMKS